MSSPLICRYVFSFHYRFNSGLRYLRALGYPFHSVSHSLILQLPIVKATEFDMAEIRFNRFLKRQCGVLNAVAAYYVSV
jgi:hypothetical protein